MRRPLALLLPALLVPTDESAASPRCPDAHPAQAFRRAAGPVQPLDEQTILVEAEELQGGCPGWRAGRWGENYFAATFANTFLSRKAFLGAPEQLDEAAVAGVEIEVPRPGRYLVLARYEAAPRFETQFRVRVEQGGEVRLDRLYGARDHTKIWAFGQRLQREVLWSWGATENLVWEGHDAAVELQAGRARLSLVAAAQPEPGARRNVDAILLTSDEADVRDRVAREGYLPLDGLLTQGGDLYLRLENLADAPLQLTVAPGTEHSPYWVHQRRWRPKTVAADPGRRSDWIEVGGLLDTLNDGQWTLTANAGAPGAQPRYRVALARRGPGGALVPAGSFESREAKLPLSFAADTRYGGRVRRAEDALYDLVAYLRARPVAGRPPSSTLVYGSTFEPRPADPRYTAARDELLRLLPLRGREGPEADSYLEVRGRSPAQLDALCAQLVASGAAGRVRVVSLGDEIDLPAPAGDAGPGFHDWLRAQGLRPAEVDPGARDWADVRYDPDRAGAAARSGVFLYSRRYRNRYGLRALQAQTAALRRCLPQAGIGANYSPHREPMYVGDTFKWVTLFREGAMTMPWSEDYAWQLPIGSQQMSLLGLDLFRAGLRGRPDGRIQQYVMPHWPGNTPRSWRRQLYGALAHGATIFNLFELRPVQAAYTENHVSLPEMFLEVRRGLHELGAMEDLLQASRVRPAEAALFVSEVGDLWEDGRDPFAAGRRTLYVALKGQQLPLDVIAEEDALGGALGGYKAIYLTDAHVSRAAARALAAWVRGGGRLVATAGAGALDELGRPNEALRELLGIRPEAPELDAAPIRFEKQDLPFAPVLDTVRWAGPAGEVAIAVFGARARFAPTTAAAQGVFSDGTPAIAARAVGAGQAIYLGFLPGLSYFRPALPRRPADRGATDDSFAHFVPTRFDPGAAALIGLAAADLARPVRCAEPLVESAVLEAPAGLVVPLVNWSGGPLRGLQVRTRLRGPRGAAALASGGPLAVEERGGERVYTLDLDAADALVLR